MATCSYGHANPDGTSFCQTCGLALGTAGATAAPLAVAPPMPGAPPQGWEPQPVEPYTEPPRSRPWLLPLILVGAIAVLVLGYFVFQAAKPKTTTMTVTLQLYNGIDVCNVGLGYNDVPGAEVVVLADGVTVGSGYFDYGTDQGLYCEFEATISGVPTDKDYYELEVGGGDRGSLSASQTELADNDWQWGITLGGD